MKKILTNYKDIIKEIIKKTENFSNSYTIYYSDNKTIKENFWIINIENIKKDHHFKTLEEAAIQYVNNNVKCRGRIDYPFNNRIAYEISLDNYLLVFEDNNGCAFPDNKSLLFKIDLKYKDENL